MGEVSLTTQDLLPLLVLGVALSGRNSATTKELSWDVGTWRNTRSR
ncbi:MULTISPECIES: hypothetical protein [Saccharothrix]|nr:hypothetical protein [Saccharothrix sp. CB00851]